MTRLVADQLRTLGVKGVLVQMAERGQLLALRYGWRKQIGALLAKDKSLEEIAETLNRKNVPPAHGTNRWTAGMVRKAYVS
ncbi:MAG TPA: hypothetical protein VFN18_00285 [Solirubrobacterales bacterium]|nr:hypothetical protein [Solirubrobacterales bacterium]